MSFTVQTYGPAAGIEQGSAIHGIAPQSVAESTVAAAAGRLGGRGAEVTVDVSVFTKGFFNPSGTLKDGKVTLPLPGQSMADSAKAVMQMLKDCGCSGAEINVAGNAIARALDAAPAGKSSTLR